jgi:hypothetical protein
VIIDYFDFKRIKAHPSEADTPLLIHANTVLAGTVTPQRFQPIAGSGCQVPERCCRMDLVEFSLRHWRNPLKFTAELASEHPFGLLVAEGPNHTAIILPERV